MLYVVSVKYVKGSECAEMPVDVTISEVEDGKKVSLTVALQGQLASSRRRECW